MADIHRMDVADWLQGLMEYVTRIFFSEHLSLAKLFEQLQAAEIFLH